MLCLKKKKAKKSPKKAQHSKIEKFAGSVCLSLFMDGTVKCKLPFTPPTIGLTYGSYHDTLSENQKKGGPLSANTVANF
jgi:hypothetical protein